MSEIKEVPYRAHINGKYWGVFYASDEQEAEKKARDRWNMMTPHYRTEISEISVTLLKD